MTTHESKLDEKEQPVFDAQWTAFLEDLQADGLSPPQIYRCAFRALANTAIGSGLERSDFVEDAGAAYDEKKPLHEQ